MLFAADLNAEFDNILNNGLSVVSPWTANMDAGGFRLIGLALGTVGNPTLQLTGDANTGIYSSAADTVDIAAGGVRAASFGASSLISAAPEDSRTTTVDVVHEFRSTTSGTPAAGIGTGILVSAESADENPSNVGELDFVFTDITAASEDSVLDILLRTAGAALGSRYRFQATGAFRALFTHAMTANRTITFPDSDVTLGAGVVSRAGSQTTAATTTSTTDVTLLTITLGTAIAVATPFIVFCSVRKTSGAAAAASVNISFNGGSNMRGTTDWSSNADQAETGLFMFFVGARASANHLRPGSFLVATSNGASQLYGVNNANMPNADITTIEIHGVVANAAVTMEADDAHAYAFATS